MTILFAKSRHFLRPGQLRSEVAQRPHIVRVEHGLVWLTIEGGPGDHWLAAGAALPVEPGLLVVIEAQVDSRILLEAIPASGERGTGRPAVWPRPAGSGAAHPEQ